MWGRPSTKFTGSEPSFAWTDGSSAIRNLLAPRTTEALLSRNQLFRRDDYFERQNTNGTRPAGV